MLSYILLQGRFSPKPPIDSMRGLPDIIGWIALFAIGYIVFRVWFEIRKSKEGEKD
jgi:hypothetical protein